MQSSKCWYKQLRFIQYNLQMKDTPLMDAEKIAREMEVQPRPDQDGDIILANTKHAFNRTWALLED